MRKDNKAFPTFVFKAGTPESRGEVKATEAAKVYCVKLVPVPAGFDGNCQACKTKALHWLSIPEKKVATNACAAHVMDAARHLVEFYCIRSTQKRFTVQVYTERVVIERDFVEQKTFQVQA